MKKTLFVGLGGLALSAGAAWLVLAPDDVPGKKAKSPQDKIQEFALYHDLRNGEMPPGAMRAGVQQKAALEFAKANISGANGSWREYGRGSLIASGLAQNLGAGAPDTNTLIYAGRVDNFAYDPVGKRLFAAVGTGGIWMSEAQNDDVTTLGEHWVSVSNNLPTQATGGVVWTPARGGTLIAASGDGVMSTGGYLGLGAFWSSDLGGKWEHASGFPDEAKVFNARADLGNPEIVYIASSRGLFRSEDAGRSYKNVALPTTPECAGNEDRSSACLFANVVSDVAVMAPGGVENFECSHEGCPVLAAVGWRAGRKTFPGTDIPQAPANGLYKSATGEPGTFVRLEQPALNPATEQGFTPAERIGRIEMGNAIGPDQDHRYVYALVQDSEALNGDALGFDPPLDAVPPPVPLGYLSGVFVSPDFGETWMRMANVEELAPSSAFAALLPPGVQSWYNMWIQPDPTRSFPVLGVPTRLGFGMEEAWANRGSAARIPLNGIAQAGPNDFEVIGRYFSAVGESTTHPDHHAGIFVPTGDGGVCLFEGNDGGVSKQCLTAAEELDNNKWGRGANQGFYTLLPYGLGVAKDGTVWFGFQDNSSGNMEPDSGQSFQAGSGDGFFAEVDPDNSDIGYFESQNGGLNRTMDRGQSYVGIDPPYTRVNFANWFSMDPTNGKHMITTANEIYETLDATTVTSSSWKRVFALGKNPDTKVIRTAQVADVHGDAIYAGYCGDCGVTVNDTGFQNGIATNVGGSKPPKAGTSNGWHHASAKGLPNRLIRGIEIDPSNPSTVYVALGGYMSGLRGPGSFGDPNTNIGSGYLFKSTDAGETFTDITGSLPQMPVASVLVRGSQLIVGTDLGAFISSDLDGTEWATLGNSLTSAPITMLKLRPGNPNELFASTFGRHIWHYTFTGDAELKVAPAASAPKAEGRGLVLGAFPPALLAVLGGLWMLRRRRH